MARLYETTTYEGIEPIHQMLTEKQLEFESYSQVEEASTHKSAKVHAGTVCRAS